MQVSARNPGRYGDGRSALVGQVRTHKPHAVQESAMAISKIGITFTALTEPMSGVVITGLASVGSFLLAISAWGIRPYPSEGRCR